MPKTLSSFQTPETMPEIHSVIIDIRGLREIAPGRFELDGVKDREIDHRALAEAIGATEDDIELMDKVVSSILKFDMVNLLTDRIKV